MTELFAYTAVKNGRNEVEPQRPLTIARSLAIGNPADGPLAAKMIKSTGGFAEDVSDVEVVAGIQELAETEGIFTETAGGVTTAVTAKLIAQGRIGAACNLRSGRFRRCCRRPRRSGWRPR